MIQPEWFHDEVKKRGITFFTGVPDSLLKSYCNVVAIQESDNHRIAANEGASVGLAAGHYLGSGAPSLVYLQNSGLGNLVNPLVSLASPDVYGIPMLLLIGWRGEPDRPDEPQHMVQGRITRPMLECMNIPHLVLPDTPDAVEETLDHAFKVMKDESTPFALVVPKGRFEAVQYRPASLSELSRETAIQMIADALPRETLIVATTGKISRELYEHRIASKQSESSDFLTVGSMGHASAIALGLATSRPDRTVVCLDGDGAMLMHLGTIATIATSLPKNLIHLVLNNGCHESVGGLPSAADTVSLSALLKAAGYPNVSKVTTATELRQALTTLEAGDTQALEVVVSAGSRNDLGRPKRTPREAKEAFMKAIHDT